MGCTLLPFTLGLVAMRHLSAFSTALALNLEPVYAIMLAILLLDEQRELAWPFYVGVAIILAVVLFHARIMERSPVDGSDVRGALRRCCSSCTWPTVKRVCFAITLTSTWSGVERQKQPMQSFPDLDALARIFDRRSLRFEILSALGCTFLRRLLHFVPMLFGAAGRGGYEFVRLTWGSHLCSGRRVEGMRRKITERGHYTARPIALLCFRLTWPRHLRA